MQLTKVEKLENDILSITYIYKKYLLQRKIYNRKAFLGHSGWFWMDNGERIERSISNALYRIMKMNEKTVVL